MLWPPPRPAYCTAFFFVSVHPGKTIFVDLNTGCLRLFMILVIEFFFRILKLNPQNFKKQFGLMSIIHKNYLVLSWGIYTLC